MWWNNQCHKVPSYANGETSLNWWWMHHMLHIYGYSFVYVRSVIALFRLRWEVQFSNELRSKKMIFRWKLLCFDWPEVFWLVLTVADESFRWYLIRQSRIGSSGSRYLRCIQNILHQNPLIFIGIPLTAYSNETKKYFQYFFELLAEKNKCQNEPAYQKNIRYPALNRSFAPR